MDSNTLSSPFAHRTDPRSCYPNQRKLPAIAQLTSKTQHSTRLIL